MEGSLKDTKTPTTGSHPVGELGRTCLSVCVAACVFGSEIGLCGGKQHQIVSLNWMSQKKEKREEEKRPNPNLSVRLTLPPLVSFQSELLSSCSSLYPLPFPGDTHTHTHMLTFLKPQMIVSRPEQVLDVSPQPLTFLMAHKENRPPPSAPTGHT